MRMIMLVQLPVEPFNTATRKGTAGAKMKKILDATKPEAVYFTEREGHRGGILIVDVESPSDIPRLAEPWFLSFNAEVEFRKISRGSLEVAVVSLSRKLNSENVQLLEAHFAWPQIFPVQVEVKVDKQNN